MDVDVDVDVAAVPEEGLVVDSAEVVPLETPDVDCHPDDVSLVAAEVDAEEPLPDAVVLCDWPLVVDQAREVLLEPTTYPLLEEELVVACVDAELGDVYVVVTD